MASGISDALKKAGAKRREKPTVWTGLLFFPKENDPQWGHLAHPRFHDPIDEALVVDIVDSCEVREDIIVWELVACGHEVTQGGVKLKKGDVLLIVCDGSQRSVCSLEAERRMHKAGKLEKGKEFHVSIRRFHPASPETAVRDFLIARQAYDSARLKRPHAPSVIAQIYIQAAKYQATVEQLLASAPNGYTKRIVECLLCWPSLEASAAKAFDVGLDDKPVPIAFLPAIMRLPQPDQMPALRDLMANEITSTQGATKFLNGQARQEAMAAAVDEVPEGAADAAEDDQSNVGMTPTKTMASVNPNGRRQPAAGKDRPSTKDVRRLFEQVSSAKPSKHARLFMLGAVFDRGDEVDCNGMSKDALAIIDGIMFSRGAGIAKGDIPEEVRLAMKGIVDEARAKERKKAAKAVKEAESKGGEDHDPHEAEA